QSTDCCDRVSAYSGRRILPSSRSLRAAGDLKRLWNRVWAMLPAVVRGSSEKAVHGGQINMIPRKIHYCWFGGAEKPDLVQFCVRSCHEHCTGYEIIEWNEQNFPIESF